MSKVGLFVCLLLFVVCCLLFVVCVVHALVVAAAADPLLELSMRGKFSKAKPLPSSLIDPTTVSWRWWLSWWW